MRIYPIFRKSLSLVVIAMLLSLPLVSITGNPDFVSAKTTPTELAYTSHEADTGGFSLIKTEPEHSLGGGLSLSEDLQLAAAPLQSSNSPRTLLPPQEVASEVPIPPNIIS